MTRTRLLVEAEDWRRAARLFGVADGLLGTTAAPWQHPESTYRAASVGRTKEHVDAAVFETEHGKGRALCLEGAIQYCQAPG